jgi:hypothetical protein
MAQGERRGPLRDGHPAGRGGLRILCRGAVVAGLRGGWAPPGAGEGDGADNGAAHRTAEAADEARTNPLVGLGRKAGRVEHGWHRKRV